jgi:hypothetical protein
VGRWRGGEDVDDGYMVHVGIGICIWGLHDALKERIDGVGFYFLVYWDTI